LRTVVACEGLLGANVARRLADLTCAYGLVLEETFQGHKREKELSLLLRDSDLAALSVATDRPIVVVGLLAETLVEAASESSSFAGSPHFPRLLAFVDQLGHSVTKCQRLMKPPVPKVRDCAMLVGYSSLAGRYGCAETHP
jgi:predicted membrane chloride channel (bestrophin family)